MSLEERRLVAALYGLGQAAFKLWATVRIYELSKEGERATLVLWFDKRALDAEQVERIGEPEFAVRRASGKVERAPSARPPPLRVVRRAG